MAKKEAKPKAAPVGRPSKYDPKYCSMLIDHMASGLSFESFAAEIDVCVDTIYAWSNKEHDSFVEEFSEAKKKAYVKNLLHWEKVGQEGLWDITEYNDQGKPTYKKSLNSTVWIFNMKNRHRWKDRQELEVDATVRTSPLKEELRQKSTEELLEIMQKAKGNDNTP